MIICALFAASLRKRQADKLTQQMKPIELHDFSRQCAIACGFHYHQANVRKLPRVRAALGATIILPDRQHLVGQRPRLDVLILSPNLWTARAFCSQLKDAGEL